MISSVSGSSKLFTFVVPFDRPTPTPKEGWYADVVSEGGKQYRKRSRLWRNHGILDKAWAQFAINRAGVFTFRAFIGESKEPFYTEDFLVTRSKR